MDENIIWNDRLDGLFDCKVTRTSEYSGQLTIEAENGDVILDEPVSLSFGAMFGPDSDDVASWQERCVLIVDSLGMQDD